MSALQQQQQQHSLMNEEDKGSSTTEKFKRWQKPLMDGVINDESQNYSTADETHYIPNPLISSVSNHHSIEDLLSKNQSVTVLEQGNYKIYLVGTAHVSEESAKQVTEVIEEKRPSIVILELCSSRRSLLVESSSHEKKQVSNRGLVASLILIFSEYMKSSNHSNLLHAILGYFMQSVSNQLNIKLGIEMIAAYKTAIQIQSKVILGDRPIDITLNRLWYSLSWFQKLKLIANIVYECTQQITAQDIEMLKQSDLLTEILEELSETYPQLSKVLVDERDAYLTHSILKAIEYLENERQSKERDSEEEHSHSDYAYISTASNLSTNMDSTKNSTNITEISNDTSIIDNVTQISSSDADDEIWNRFGKDEFSQAKALSDDELNPQDQLDPNAIVCVVGAGHVAGISKYFSSPEKINRREIMKRQKDSRNFVLIFLFISFLCYF
ncbi:hypothetical protein C9374_008907 [Naegleria lovaniensis]|uniref:TraB domain-containing protein n=1 Tax=Naegleria lovaniensis TaxID=51637 RepID=A0AA88GI79_NAELO|nr:uncharacterized protein C9374_008907 [Naegleria lovaniensis]KAG2377822.1 hypothetical protein C9374_008907 [Naegleria lovaniensis]